MLKIFPEEYEKFREITDRVSFSKQFNLIDNKCSSCNSYNHVISQCPMVHIVKDSYRAILLYNHSK